MILDGYEVADGTTFECDLLLVGGGLAGLALAREFVGRPVRVIVLESGGEQPEPDSQSLCEGEARLVDGAGATSDMGGYLTESRLRCLGGAGNIWGAKCARLDEPDFLQRAWFPESGWPFARAELDPWYERACERLEIDSFRYDTTREFDPGRPPLALERFETATRHFSPVRGGPGSTMPAYKQAVTGADNVRVLLHSNAVEIETDEAARRARAVRVRTLRKNEFRVAARAIVLAAGGIENARLLLCSRRAAPEGLGNRHDLVGRYFANHATFGPGAAIGFTRARPALDLYTTRDARKIWGVLALSGAAQRGAELGNFTVTMGPREGPPDPGDGPVLAAADLADRGYVPAGRAPDAPVPVYFMNEQIPNRESRMVLSDRTDALGLPRVRLEWSFLAADEDHMRRAVRLFGRELGQKAIGRVRCDWEERGPLFLDSWSRHHIGMTRMHRDPARGVVDPDARVHGVESLFVAGSSVFPTSGIANPTLTLIALALRLADHLQKELR
jgi:choline dehydrogenase-like flavoprotein